MVHVLSSNWSDLVVRIRVLRELTQLTSGITDLMTTDHEMRINFKYIGLYTKGKYFYWHLITL